MGQLDGKVAFITGAARGQGRSHALRLAPFDAVPADLDLFVGRHFLRHLGLTPSAYRRRHESVAA